eukprot:gene11337-4505_t
MSSSKEQNQTNKLDDSNFEKLIEEFSLLRTEVKLLREELKTTNKTTKEIIKLNVGGTCFQTLEDTLVSEKGTFFISMLQKGFKIEENEFFIDRDPKWFPFVLNFLRKGKVQIGHLNITQIQELIDELEFYHIDNYLQKVSLIYQAKCISEELCECVENGLNNEKSIYFYDLSSKQKIVKILKKDKINGNKGAIILSSMLKTNQTITTLYLSNNSIGDNGAIAIADAIKENPRIVNLYLDGNSIGDTGAIAIISLLHTNQKIHTLSLHSNHLGESSALAVAEALKINSNLSTLYLSNNFISNKGAIAIANSLKENSTLLTLYLFNQNNSLDVNLILQMIQNDSKIKPKIY